SRRAGALRSRCSLRRGGGFGRLDPRPVLAPAEKTEEAAPHSQDVPWRPADLRTINLTILPLVDPTLPKTSFWRFHRQKNVQSKDRSTACGGIGVIRIHASRLFLPRDDTPQDAVAIVDPNVGSPVGSAPFARRLGGCGVACKQKCRSQDRRKGAHHVS